ncbi:hypothetical protein AVEN_85782-1, partial [Araneus ventricosus]
FLPESARWLISQGMYSEAAVILNRIAETNGKPIDPAELRLKIKNIPGYLGRPKKFQRFVQGDHSLAYVASELQSFPLIPEKVINAAQTWGSCCQCMGEIRPIQWHIYGSYIVRNEVDSHWLSASRDFICF